MQPDDPARIEAALIRLVRRANDPRGNKAIQQMAGTEIERAGAVMLARVEEHEPARLSTLADAAGVDVSTASRQVARLVDEGYVLRQPDPCDGRASAHSLSPSGQDLRHRLAAARRSWIEDLLADFEPEDRASFADLLDRFVAAMGASHLAATAT